MKLKKIASLALAGVMAVSMLAGCATQAPETGDENVTVTTTSTGAVETFNGVQDAVEFSSNATLQSALEQAVKSVGTKNNNFNIKGVEDGEDYVEAYIKLATGANYVDDFEAKKDSTILVVKRIGSTSGLWTTDAVVKSVAMDMKKVADAYSTTTFEKNVTVSDAKYYDYAYTGAVAVASATAGTGATAYYVAYTVTRTVTEQTYTK